jgi:hypothetical protein
MCSSGWNENCRGYRSTRKPPQIPHDLTWGGTRAAAVGSRRLIAWTVARSLSVPYRCVLWDIYFFTLHLTFPTEIASRIFFFFFWKREIPLQVPKTQNTKN